jgi:hypothetical protein
LRRFSQLVDPLPVEIVDTLAYTLLMQGDFTGCLQALLPLREHPGRSFWLHHKLGDALRGLNRLEEAVRAYRRSLLDGSSSALTWRNLLQCLNGIAPQLAVAELEDWQQRPDGVPQEAWQGARAAALLVPGAGLVEQLWRCGQADPACRRRLLEEACYRLELHHALAVLAQQERSGGLSPWEQVLARRLDSLGVQAKQPPQRAASGRGVAVQLIEADQG